MQAVDGERAEHRVIQHHNDNFGRTHGTALILLAAAVALAPYATARFGFRGFVTVYAVAALSWLPLRNLALRPAHVFVIAIALRLPLLFAEPMLSGDVYRYLSDGRVVAAGENPYAYTPTDPRINHPEIRSIYPPHAQLLFGLVHQLTGWRILIVVLDIIAIAFLYGPSSALRAPSPRTRGEGSPPASALRPAGGEKVPEGRMRGRPSHALAYATFPMLLFEGTWSGHVDAIAGVLLGVALLRESGAAAAFASGLKIIPFAAVPVLFRRATNRTRFALWFLAALAIPVVPFLGRPIMPGFRDYATRWIFNSPLYDVLFTVLDRIPTKEIWTHHPLRFELISDFVYRHLYTDFLTRAVMAALAIGLIACARRASTAIAALLLCSPAIHPWYWLVLVPVSMIEESRWIWLALAAPLSYLLYEGVNPLIVYVACYGLGVRWQSHRSK